jgi:hypothetical protein
LAAFGGARPAVTFAAPLWLVGLVPLAAVVVYLLWGRRRQEAVPFLDLWLGPVKGPRPRRKFAAPPVVLALAIGAMLLSLLASARPAWRDGGGAGAVTVIIDRGATMSAGQRFGQMASALAAVLAANRSPAVDLIVMPGGEVEHLAAGTWAARVNAFGPTAMDTTAALNAAAARRLAETAGPVIVVTDRALATTNDRLIRVSPAAPAQDAGIVLLAARSSPRAQVMVRVRNGAAQGRRELRVSSAGREVVQTIDLPPSPDETRDYFVDVEALGDVVKAQLTGGDDFAGDDVAWLVREGAAPRVEPRGPIPPELQRMIDVYEVANPPRTDAPPALVVRDAAGLAPASPGVVLAAATDAAPAGASVEIRPHSVTRDTHWEFQAPARLAAPPGQDWATVVALGGKPAVAVREAPARQVWVGVDAQDWPRTPDYVVFWANVFDWLGAGEIRFAAHSPARLDGAWTPVELPGGLNTVDEPGLWPGLYRRQEDGALRAVNAGDVRFPALAAGDWRPQLERALAADSRAAATPLSSAFLLAALASAGLAAAAWKRGPNRSAARHLAAT